MKSSSQLKQAARSNLTNHWGLSIGITVVQNVITSTVSSFLSVFMLPLVLPIAILLFANFEESIADTLTQLISTLFSLPTQAIAMLATAPLLYGFTLCFLKLVLTNTLNFNDLFAGFKRAFKKSFLTQLLISIYVFLWSLLFIIPGIVKALSYSMSYYILIDNPHFTASQAIAESEKMMKGHKADLFVLQLSFIGWMLLSVLTCCIGFIFLVPYMKTAEAHFYQNLKAQQNSTPNPTNVTF